MTTKASALFTAWDKVRKMKAPRMSPSILRSVSLKLLLALCIIGPVFLTSLSTEVQDEDVQVSTSSSFDQLKTILASSLAYGENPVQRVRTQDEGSYDMWLPGTVRMISERSFVTHISSLASGTIVLEEGQCRDSLGPGQHCVLDCGVKCDGKGCKRNCGKAWHVGKYHMGWCPFAISIKGWIERMKLRYLGMAGHVATMAAYPVVMTSGIALVPTGPLLSRLLYLTGARNTYERELGMIGRSVMRNSWEISALVAKRALGIDSARDCCKSSCMDCEVYLSNLPMVRARLESSNNIRSCPGVPRRSE